MMWGADDDADRGLAESEATFSLLRAAIARHVAWACQYAIVGDYSSAVDALLDAEAMTAELESRPPGR